MNRPKILPATAPLADRLRVHAFRMAHDKTIATNGYGFSTETWERDDLEAVLEEAATAIDLSKKTT